MSDRDQLPAERGPQNHLRIEDRYPFLDAHAARLVEATTEAKTSDMGRPRYILHADHEPILEDLQARAAYASRAVRRDLLLFGPPWVGKTTIIRMLQQTLPENRGPSGQILKPVVHFWIPSPPREGDFWLALLEACGTFKKPTSASALRHYALEMLRRVQCGMLVIDNVHHLSNASKSREQRAMLGLLKDLVDRVTCPIILIGREAAQEVFIYDQDLEMAFEYIEMKPMKYNSDFCDFLDDFEATLPFPVPSNLNGNEISRLLHGETAGNIGILTKWLVDTSIFCLNSNQKSITLSALKQTKRATISDRQRKKRI